MTPETLSALESLFPLLALSTVLFGAMAVFGVLCAVKGRPHTPSIEARESSIFMHKWFLEYWYWLWEPVVRACIALRVTPNAITWLSTSMVCVAAWLIARGDLSAGGWLYLFGASFDLVDGKVARATGQSTRAGAFLDSTLDRVAELAVFAALAVQFRETPVLYAAILAAAASVLVSYTRARGEGLGLANEARTGGMQRAERIVYTGIACAFAPLADWWAGEGAGRVLVGAGVTLLAVLASLTAIRRGAAIFRALRAEETAMAKRPVGRPVAARR